MTIIFFSVSFSVSYSVCLLSLIGFMLSRHLSRVSALQRRTGLENIYEAVESFGYNGCMGTITLTRERGKVGSAAAKGERPNLMRRRHVRLRRATSSLAILRSNRVSLDSAQLDL